MRKSIIVIILNIITITSIYAQDFEWAKQIGGTSFDNGYSIKTDNSGNVYITGSFWNTVDFDPDSSGVYNLTSAGNSDIFIQKLDSAGNFIWAKRMGGPSYDVGLSIAIDNYGNVYVTGSFRNTVDFNPGSGVFMLSSVGDKDIFVQKLDSAGNFIWAKRMGGGSPDNGRSITVDNSGNVYTTGSFYGATDFDPGIGYFNLVSAGGDDIFIQKLDSTGNFIWAKRMGGTSNDIGTFITLDSIGNIFTTGSFRNVVDFNPGSGSYMKASAGGDDIFIQKLDSAGSFIWTKTMGGASMEEGRSIAIDNDGNVHIAGWFGDTVDFDPGSGVYNLMSAGGWDIFIQKLTSTGNFIWAKRMGGTSTDWVHSIVTDDFGNVYTTGSYRAVADFDPGIGVHNLSTSGYENIFIQKLDNVGNFVWVEGYGAAGYDIGQSITIDNTGYIYITGHFNGTVDFDYVSGNGNSNFTSAGNADVFILKLSPYSIGFTTSQSTFTSPPFNVIYTNTSRGYNSFHWDFGDGNTSNLENPTYTYAYNGTYNVTLYAMDTMNSYIDSVSATISCTGGSLQPQPPSFTTSQSTFTSPPFNVIYTNTSVGYNSFLWDFGDGNTSNLENPTHTYLYNGIYQATLFATDTVGNYTDSVFATISCSGGSTQPQPPSFTTSQSSFASPPFNVIFTNTSSIYNSFQWFFGDGDTSNLENPTHLYTANGIYQATLIATDTVSNYIDSVSAIISCSGLGINTTSSNGLSMKIYPSPNKGKFTLEISSTINKPESYQLEVYTVMGKLIHQEKIDISTTMQKQMNLGALSIGSYYIVLRNENGVLNTRFIVE